MLWLFDSIERHPRKKQSYLFKPPFSGNRDGRTEAIAISAIRLQVRVYRPELAANSKQTLEATY